MPEAGTGKWQLQDFDAELVAHGFDRYPVQQRYNYINFAVRDIARQFQWVWEINTVQKAVAPGTPYLTLTGAAPDITNFSSVEYVTLVTDPYRRQLKTMSEDLFVKQWLSRDLTAAVNRSVPSRYIVFANRLYIIPPTQAALTFEIQYRQTPVDMAGLTDVTLLPHDFDELIVLAALERCHRRAKETNAEAEVKAKQGEIINDMLSGETWVDPHRPTRTIPDRTWA